MHHKCLVIVPEADDVERQVEALLAQYDEALHQYDEDAGETYDPDGWWDYWRIGGSWDTERNVLPVREAAELSCWTIVAPDGSYRHAQHWDDDDRYVETPDFAEFRARTLLANRDHFAVVVDYHS